MRHPQVPLGEIADLIRGITYKPADVCDPNAASAVACMRTKNVQEALDESDIVWIPDSLIRNPAKYLKPGDILVSSANSWNLVGKGCWVPELNYPASAGGFISILRGDSDAVDLRYLYHWFVSPQTQSKLRSYSNKTTNISNLDHGRTLATEIPLPPLEEQRRIAAILDKASAIRSNSERAVKNAADIKASLFDEAFITHDRHGHWEQLALGELCDVQGGLQVTSARSSMPIRVPYLRVANVLRGKLDLAEIKEINCSQPELDRTRLQSKDLLVVEGHGNPNEIGRVAMWIEQPGEMVHQNHLIRVRSKSSSLDPEFLCFYLNSTMGRRHLLQRANTTSGLNTISTSAVRSAPIIVPPIDDQRSFCEKIKAIAQLETSLRIGITLHAQLSRSLLSEFLDK